MDLLDALDYFLLEDFLTMLDIRRGVCLVVGASVTALGSMIDGTCAELWLVFEVKRLPFHLCFCESPKVRRSRAIGWLQVVELEDVVLTCRIVVDQVLGHQGPGILD